MIERLVVRRRMRRRRERRGHAAMELFCAGFAPVWCRLGALLGQKSAQNDRFPFRFSHFEIQIWG